MQTFDLLIKGANLLTMDGQGRMIKNAAIGIIGDSIAWIGSSAQDDLNALQTIDTGNSVIMPGLINVHTHSAMVFFRGMAEDMGLDEWLKQVIWPAEAKFVTPDFVRMACELACLEMIRAGTTCFNDMYFYTQETARVARRCGIRACIGEGILDFPTPGSKTPEDAIRRTLELVDEFGDSGLIQAVLNPHSIYTCSGKTLQKVRETAEEKGMRVHMHLSESQKEKKDSLKTFGSSPVEYLRKSGLLNKNFLAAHCVWLDDEELEIFKDAGASIGHCPISNMKLSSGRAPVRKYLDSRVNIGIGTDGAASNNSLDLWSDIRACALLDKLGAGAGQTIKAEQIVRMATINGAHALGLGDITGSIEVGKKADLITLSLDKPHLQPCYDLYSTLVYSGSQSDVDNVIINGKILIQNRQVLTINEEEVLTSSKKYTIRLADDF